MLGQVAPTQYDMRFVLFGISVRVHPLFWLIAAAIGFGGATDAALDLNSNPVTVVVIWVACMFLSILVHEFGHALVAKWFGWHPHIVLHSFGGYAAYQPGWDNTAGKSILIALAGPFAGFILLGIPSIGGLVAVGVWGLPSYRVFDFLPIVLKYLSWINIVWGVINLLPVFPLDGGRVCSEICRKLSPPNGDRITYQIGMVIAGGVAAFFLFGPLVRMPIAAMMFAFLGFQNYQAMQMSGRGYY